MAGENDGAKLEIAMMVPRAPETKGNQDEGDAAKAAMWWDQEMVRRTAELNRLQTKEICIVGSGHSRQTQ